MSENEKVLQQILSAINGITQEQKNTQNEIKGLNEKVTVLDERVSGMDEKVTGLDERITSIEDNMATNYAIEMLTNKIDTITNQVASNAEKLDLISVEQKLVKQATVDTRQDVTQIQGDITSLKDGQERQDKILESLSLRSLEQETDIRDLKRIK